MYNEVDMIWVESSNIESIGYNANCYELYIRFLSGQTYVYYNVSEEIYNGLLVADSKGKFFNAYIKGQYDCNKI